MDDQLARAASNPTGISRAAQQVLEKMAFLPNPLEVDLSLKELARRTGIGVELLRRQFEQVKSRQIEHENRVQRRPPAAVPAEKAAPLPKSPPRPPARAQEGLTSADGKLLRLLVFEAEVREQFQSQGVEVYFYDALACRLAEELLSHLADVVPGQELNRLQQRPELMERLPKPLVYDPAEYAGAGRQMLETYRRKTADRRRRQQLKAGQ
jgi:DNA primase